MATNVSPDVPPEPTFARIQRAPRYLFIARFKATDAISGMQVEGLTTDLSEGGCCVMARRAPFSPGTPILLEIAKNGVTLSTNATVVYNLRDQVIGLCFAPMTAAQAVILAAWLKAAVPAPTSR